MTPNSILLMSGAITNDDMRMHAHMPGWDRTATVCVCVCTVPCVCVGACRHVKGYIGQTSEVAASPRPKYQAKCQSLRQRDPADR